MDQQIIKIIQDTIIKYFPSSMYIYNYIDELRYRLQGDYNVMPPFTMSKKLYNRYRRLIDHHPCTSNMLYVNECHLNQLLTLPTVTSVRDYYNYPYSSECKKQIYNRILVTLDSYKCYSILDKFVSFVRHNLYGIDPSELIYLYAYNVFKRLSHKECIQFMIGYYKDFVNLMMDYDIFIVQYMKELETAMVNEIHSKIKQYTEYGDQLQDVHLYHIYSNSDDYDTMKKSMFIYRLCMLKMIRANGIFQYMQRDNRITNYCWRTKSYIDNIYSIHSTLKRANSSKDCNYMLQHDNIVKLISDNSYKIYITNLLLGSFSYDSFYHSDHLIPYAPILYGFELKYNDDTLDRIYKVNEVIFKEDPHDVIETMMVTSNHYKRTYKKVAIRIKMHPEDIVVDRLSMTDMSTSIYTDSVSKVIEMQSNIRAKFNYIGGIYKKINKKKAQISDLERTRITCRKSCFMIPNDVVNRYSKMYIRCLSAVRNWIIFARENLRVYNEIIRRVDSRLYKLLSRDTRKMITDVYRRRGILMRPRIIIQAQQVDCFRVMQRSCYITNPITLEKYYMYDEAKLHIFDKEYTKINLIQRNYLYQSINVQMNTPFNMPISNAWNPIVLYVEIRDTSSNQLLNIYELTNVSSDVYGRLFVDICDFIGKSSKYNFFSSHQYKTVYPNTSRYDSDDCRDIIESSVRKYYSEEEEIQIVYHLLQRFIKKYMDKFSSTIPSNLKVASFVNLIALLQYYGMDEFMVNEAMQTIKVV